uniref:Neurotransmitter-gated ion-channel transmembrane domain-containing protein n=1 Tax=Syphacia muris TaxID=451379 RepID=A0A158R4E7_9BILA
MDENENDGDAALHNYGTVCNFGFAHICRTFYFFIHNANGSEVSSSLFIMAKHSIQIEYSLRSFSLQIFLIAYTILFGLTTKEESLSAELSCIDVWIGLTAFWYTVELHVIFATVFRIYSNNKERGILPPTYEKVLEMDKKARKSSPPSYEESQTIYTIFNMERCPNPVV